MKRDIRVGDTVRVVGKVDEFMRTNVEGKEWVRRLWVDESSGGSIGACVYRGGTVTKWEIMLTPK